MYLDSVMNYTGSKYKLLSQILPLFDYTKTNFVDVFVGGGSVYINVLDKYETVLINDIISDLVNLHKSLIDGDEILNNTKKLCSTLKENQQDYIKLRDDYNTSPTPHKLWALMLSCNSNLIRFNQKGIFNQTWGQRTWNSNTEKKVKLFTNHIRKYSHKISFSSRKFNQVELLKETFYYLDPPYGFIKDENGNIGKKQISEAGYNNFYYQEDDMNLYNYCHSINQIGSTFMISGVLEHGGKTSWILDKLISDGFRFIELKFDYDKINKTKTDKNTREIIVMNY